MADLELIFDCHEENPVLKKLHELYYGLLKHDGFGEIRIEIRILKRGQKEVILHSGKQFRFVVDYPPKAETAKARREVCAK